MQSSGAKGLFNHIVSKVHALNTAHHCRRPPRPLAEVVTAGLLHCKAPLFLSPCGPVRSGQTPSGREATLYLPGDLVPAEILGAELLLRRRRASPSPHLVTG